jgi:hypothetical protein
MKSITPYLINGNGHTHLIKSFTLYPQIQFQLVANPKDFFVIPAITSDIKQLNEAEPKTPAFTRIESAAPASLRSQHSRR